MKYLFCGLGSVGERHLANLLKLGETDVIAWRTTKRPPRHVKRHITSYSSLDQALAQKPDVAFITNPTSRHLPIALKAAATGCHLFVEKPLSSNPAGVAKLKKIVDDNKLIVQIGFMMRYHPAVRQIKDWLTKGKVGQPVCARACWGEYLPSWHPWEDYTKSYAARKSMGGGPINTLCHDVDLATWFFGLPKSIFALTSRNSTLKISTEHSAEILLEFKNRAIAQIHVDFLQSPPKRTWQIVGDRGKIEFDYYTNVLYLYTQNPKTFSYKKKRIAYGRRFERNMMFVDELKDFLHAVAKKETPTVTLEDGITNLNILLAAHRSIKERRIVYYGTI